MILLFLEQAHQNVPGHTVTNFLSPCVNISPSALPSASVTHHSARVWESAGSALTEICVAYCFLSSQVRLMHVTSSVWVPCAPARSASVSAGETVRHPDILICAGFTRHCSWSPCLYDSNGVSGRTSTFASIVWRSHMAGEQVQIHSRPNHCLDILHLHLQDIYRHLLSNVLSQKNFNGSCTATLIEMMMSLEYFNNMLCKGNYLEPFKHMISNTMMCNCYQKWNNEHVCKSLWLR